MLLSSYRREKDALELALVVAAVGTLWGWAFATEGGVPWWTYFIVTLISAFLIAYWILGDKKEWEEMSKISSAESCSPTVEEIKNLKNLATYRKEFLANVSHELKTSVFVVQGFLDALQDERKELSKSQQHLLERARSNLDQLAQLTENILKTSLMESGAIRMQNTRFCIRQLSEQLLEDFQKNSATQKIKLSLLAPSSHYYIYADKQYLQQVMRNLIQNAIRYNRPKGSVYIQLQEENNYVKVSVKDTGIGIPADEQSRIFERFYRVEKSRSKNEGGTGIGLALVKHILEAHQCKIGLQSKVGVGTKIYFSLPTDNSQEKNTVLIETESHKRQQKAQPSSSLS